MERDQPEVALAGLREALRIDRREFLTSFVPNFLPVERDEMLRAKEEAVARFGLFLLFARPCRAHPSFRLESSVRSVLPRALPRLTRP